MNELIEPLARMAGFDGVVAEFIGIEPDLRRNDRQPRLAPPSLPDELFDLDRNRTDADQTARSRQAHPA